MKFSRFIDELSESLVFIPGELRATFEALSRYRLLVADMGSVCIDRGGPILADAQRALVDGGDTVVGVLCRDIGYYARELGDARPYELGGQFYYRLAGKTHDLILTPAQRQDLLAAWGQRLPEWQAVAAA